MAIQVWEWISNFIPHFTGHVITYPCWDSIYACIPDKNLDVFMHRDFLCYPFLYSPQTERIEDTNVSKLRISFVTNFLHKCHCRLVIRGFDLQGLSSLSGRTSCRQISCRQVSKPRDWMLKWSCCSDIWQAYRQCCCRCACKISERVEKSKPEYRGFDTSRDLVVRRPSA